MTLDAYEFWRFIHVLLFVYWLGGDLGVFLAAKYVARRDLAASERQRFLDLTVFIDMGPRTALILLPAVGFQLAAMADYMHMSVGVLIGFWLVTLGWLALMWSVFLRRHDAGIAGMRRFDIVLRYAVIVIMGGLGIVSLITRAPIAEHWLSLKLVLYAACVADGLYLRSIMVDWEKGFTIIASGGSSAEGNAIITEASIKGERFGLLMWGFLIVIGYLGVAKPF